MNHKIKAELIILIKTKMHKWIFALLLMAVLYSLYSVASILQAPEEGGYYTYTVLSLAYLIGIVEPIGIGAFLGGSDIKTGIIEYKLTNQSKYDWLLSKALAMSALAVTILICFTLAGLVMDVIQKCIYGNLMIVIWRFCIALFVWILWGAISFTLSMLFESPELSFLLCMIIYYGEQYIGRFIPVPIGIMWNQKSLEYYFFHSEQIPYGVVQTSFEEPIRSFFFLLGCLLLCCIISFLYTSKKYPQK